MRRRQGPLRPALGALLLAGLAGLVLGFALGRVSAPRSGERLVEIVTATPEAVSPTPSAAPTTVPSATAPALALVPTATVTATVTASATPAPTATPTSSPMPSATSLPTATQAPLATATTVPTATPTRGPLRVTKLGLGVYGSGGAYLADIAQWRPSVILLMDPTVEFAKDLHATYPKAFIVGRRYVAKQPLDNPDAEGAAFADFVAQLAVPLKGTVNAWMSYNEEAGYSPSGNNFAAWNRFQVAFAQRLQGTYGIDAVAGNDGPGAVEPGDYVKYFAGAIRASHYFGVHAYPPADVHSLRDPRGQDAMLRYRRIHDALAQASIAPPPFVLTETGLESGWREVESDDAMAADFIWLTGELDRDPYVLGQTVFGLFEPGNEQWRKFNVAGSVLEQLVGYYNSCVPAHPCASG